MLSLLDNKKTCSIQILDSHWILYIEILNQIFLLELELSSWDPEDDFSRVEGSQEDGDESPLPELSPWNGEEESQPEVVHDSSYPLQEDNSDLDNYSDLELSSWYGDGE